MDVRRSARTWVAAAAGASLLLVGCAYFNTLYNAKETYKQAEHATAKTTQAQQQAQPGATDPNDKLYEQVVEKCKKMIANYPDSKHVDDAMLLSARALYRLRRYDEAVAALDSLDAKFPKSNLRGDAMFLKGKSLATEKKYELAVPVLRDFTQQYHGHHDAAEGLYLLCTSLMQLDNSDEAVATLQRLEKDHGRSQFTFKAQVEMADILAEKKLYKESLDVYQRLGESRIPETYRYDVWLGMARVQEELGNHADVLATLEQTRTLARAPEKEPQVFLLRARAHTAMDSTDVAIREYRDVTTKFARTAYAAEAYYRLGELYEGTDSLQAAQKSYQEVPRASSTSDFATDAIKRSSDIGRVLKLQSLEGDNSPEAVAMRTFSMAEIQLFQFNNPQKAIASYEKVANEFATTEYAPRAIYALGYINGVVLGDTAKAREWYTVLRTRYPDTPQAELAFEFYKGAGPPPSIDDLMRASAKTHPPAQVPTGSAARDSVLTPPPPGARPDSVRVYVPARPDTTHAPGSATAPPPADTTAAPADTSRGGH